MWCDFLCDGCSKYAECARVSSNYDIEEIQHKTIRTQEEYDFMYGSLIEEDWNE